MGYISNTKFNKQKMKIFFEFFWLSAAYFYDNCLITPYFISQMIKETVKLDVVVPQTYRRIALQVQKGRIGFDQVENIHIKAKML